MCEPLAVRRYRPADAEAVWDVHEAALRASPLAFVEEAAVDDDLVAIESNYLDAGGEFLVGEIDDLEGGCDAGSDGPEIVAIGGYLPTDSEHVEIRRMRVDPDHQRQGFASSILTELERRAREDGYQRAELETVEPLQAAQAFYESAGYEVVGTTSHPETGVELYRFERPL